MDKNRQSIRLKNYDYSKSGLYFVTICTENRECLFGDVVGVGRDRPVSMILNQPNHVHFILHIVLGASQPGDTGASRRAPTTLGFIVGMFKTECTKQINKLRNMPGQKIFQRNYYEHIIRTENDLNKIREYIYNNPSMWERDRNNLL